MWFPKVGYRIGCDKCCSSYETPEASVVEDIIEAILNNNRENVSYGSRQMNPVANYLAGYVFWIWYDICWADSVSFYLGILVRVDSC